MLRKTFATTHLWQTKIVYKLIYYEIYKYQTHICNYIFMTYHTYICNYIFMTYHTYICNYIFMTYHT